MPGMDGTGPFGNTGWPCRRACVRQGAFMGGRGGYGHGRGFGRMRLQEAQPVELTEEEQKKILQAKLQELDAEKQAIEKRLREMK